MHCRLLPEVPVLASIPAALADRLEDINVTDETAVQLILAPTHIVTDQSHESWPENLLGSRLVSRRVADPHLV